MSNEAVCIANQQLYAETDKAILIGEPGLTTGRGSTFQRTWIPSSLVLYSDFEGVNSVSDVEVPKWFAIQNDLDYEE